MSVREYLKFLRTDIVYYVSIYFENNDIPETHWIVPMFFDSDILPDYILDSTISDMMLFEKDRLIKIFATGKDK